MKKEAVLHSTLELISERGIHNTPMSKIAKHADVAVGTIYHHFDSKEQILNELYLQIKSEFGDRINVVLGKNLDARKTFTEVFKAVYSYYTENPLMFVFTEQVAFTPIITDTTKEEAQKFYQPMIDFFEDHIAGGTFRDVPVELLVELVYGNIRTIVQMRLADNSQVTDDLLDEAIHASWISFATE